MKKVMMAMCLALTMIVAAQEVAISGGPIDAVKANIKAKVSKITKSVPSITVKQLKKAIEAQKVFFEIVDVRTKAEYDAGHLGGALWIPRGKAEWMTPGKIKDPSTKIYVYCMAGARGALVTKMLLDAGYKDVTNVTGGFKAWAKAGYPFYNMHGKIVVTKDGFGKKPE